MFHVFASGVNLPKPIKNVSKSYFTIQNYILRKDNELILHCDIIFMTIKDVFWLL